MLEINTLNKVHICRIWKVYQKMRSGRPGAEKMRTKVSPHMRGFVFSMGYNMISARYSPTGEYSRFTGSSLNRSLRQKKSLYGYCEKNVHQVTADLIKVVREIAKDCTGWRWVTSKEFYHFLCGEDAAYPGEFEDGLRCQVCGSVNAVRQCIDIVPPDPIRVLSSRSRGKVKDKATAFYRACPGRRCFVTLTFIERVTDRTAISLLNKFLTALRGEVKNFQFLWVAERQKENPKYKDNIHFHMIINTRLNIRRWNTMWVLQQYNAGLMGDSLVTGKKVTKAEIIDRVADGTVHKVFNPFDIKPVRSIGGLSFYLTKYITKQEGEGFDCAGWHCSRRVSRLFTKAVVSPSCMRQARSMANCRLDKETGEIFMPKLKQGAFWLYCYINVKALPLPHLREMEQINKWIIGGHVLDRLPAWDDDEYRKIISKE